MDDAEYLESFRDPRLSEIANRLRKLERLEFTSNNLAAILDARDKRIAAQRQEIARLLKAQASMRQQRKSRRRERSQSFDRQCRGKVKYESISAAKRSAKSMRKDPEIASRERIDFYECSHCGFYHVGKAPSHIVELENTP